MYTKTFYHIYMCILMSILMCGCDVQKTSDNEERNELITSFYADEQVLEHTYSEDIHIKSETRHATIARAADPDAVQKAYIAQLKSLNTHIDFGFDNEEEAILTNITAIAEKAAEIGRRDCGDAVLYMLSVLKVIDVNELNFTFGKYFADFSKVHTEALISQGEKEKLNSLINSIDAACAFLENSFNTSTPEDAIDAYIFLRAAQNYAQLNKNKDIDESIKLMENTIMRLSGFAKGAEIINNFFYDIGWMVVKRNPDNNMHISPGTIDIIIRYSKALDEKAIRPGYDEYIRKYGDIIPAPYTKPLLHRAIDILQVQNN